MKIQFLTLLFASAGTAAIAQFDMKNLKTLKLNKSQAGDKLTNLYAADFNNDGFMDLVADGSAGSQSGSIVFNSRPLFILGDGTGLLRQAPAFSLSHTGTSAFIGDVADYDRDGFIDYLVYDFWANGLRLYKGKAGMNWTLQQSMPTGVHGNIGIFKDMDMDGDLDIVSTSSGSAARNAMHLYENKGGTFTHTHYDEAIPDRDLNSPLTITDMNKDGRPDVFTITEDDKMNCWVQNADKTYTASFQNMPKGLYIRYNPDIQWFQDFNNDGFDDMVGLNGFYGKPLITVAYSEAAPPYYGADADFSDTLLSKPFGTSGKVTGDIDHDGAIDIVTFSRTGSPSGFDNVVVIYDPLNVKKNHRIEFLPFPAGQLSSAHSYILKDLNRDGNDDLVMLGKDDSLRYFYNSLPPATAIKETLNAPRPEFKCYPNPAHDFITLSAGQASLDQQIRSVVIYSAEGRAIQTHNASALNTAIDISGFAPGNYYITLTNEQGQRYTECFVKKN